MQATKEILTKIKKLYALATSSNPNEAQLAKERAELLCKKYNIALEDLEKEDTSSIGINSYKIVSDSWDFFLLKEVAEYKKCVIIRYPTPKEHAFMVSFIGDSFAVSQAQDFADYIYQAQTYGISKFEAKSSTFKTAYRMGFSIAVAKRLQDMIDVAYQDSSETDIVPTVNKDIESLFKGASSELMNDSFSATDIPGFMAGSLDGKKLSFNPQIKNDYTVKKALA
ncbi:MAG TPA: DUF2786 domain-containing protein [Methanofastidiosum sp.]|nr:DUF2786 domain-containing protein [Methanofastidiosum sp.]